MNSIKADNIATQNGSNYYCINSSKTFTLSQYVHSIAVFNLLGVLFSVGGIIAYHCCPVVALPCAVSAAASFLIKITFENFFTKKISRARAKDLLVMNDCKNSENSFLEAIENLRASCPFERIFIDFRCNPSSDLFFGDSQSYFPDKEQGVGRRVLIFSACEEFWKIRDYQRKTYAHWGQGLDTFLKDKENIFIMLTPSEYYSLVQYRRFPQRVKNILENPDL